MKLINVDVERKGELDLGLLSSMPRISTSKGLGFRPSLFRLLAQKEKEEKCINGG